jgi:formyl-CoA transferase
VIAAANDKLWRLVCRTIGQPALADDERFDTNAKRVARHAEIKPVIEAWSRHLDVDDIVEAMLAAGVPASPINTVDRLVNDPHIAGAREMFVDVEHPVAGKTKLTGSHIKLGATPARIATPAPLLGQHNEQVFGRLLGIEGERLASLRAAGVI